MGAGTGVVAKLLEGGEAWFWNLGWIPKGWIGKTVAVTGAGATGGTGTTGEDETTGGTGTLTNGAEGYLLRKVLQCRFCSGVISVALK